VPMIDQVAKVLDQLSRREWFIGENDLVLCNDVGDHFDDSALRRRFYAARSAAGLKRIRFHDLRHTFGTLAVQVFPLSDVKAFMGHADIATTMIYVHYLPQLAAADRLSRALRAAAGIESTSAVDPLLEGAARA
jgi:integrase